MKNSEIIIDIDVIQSHIKDTAIVPHGVTGIRAKIHNHLMYLGGIAQY
jgi:hypothetical protein